MQSKRDNVRALLVIFLIFLPMAFVGTMLHELGHWSVAQWYGFEPTLHYGSVSTAGSERLERYWKYVRLDPVPAEYEGVDSAGIVAYVANVHYQRTLATLGGPAQTMLTGTVGFLWLWALRRRRRLAWPLRPVEWAAVILALFWSRQVFNFLSGTAKLVSGQFPRGDEIRLASSAGYYFMPLPWWSIATLTAIIGGAVCLAVLYWFPKGYRKHLLLAGSAGSVAGFILWYGFLGPLLLP